ncbi:MAG: hypothetical protein SGBAC_013391 [Bacillariaceae sp.]
MQRIQERFQLKPLVEAPLEPQTSESNKYIDGDNFYQGVSFSPDALCLLTCRQNKLLLFNTCLQGEDWKPAVDYKTGDSVRCYQWYPQMQSNNPASCCFLGVSRDQPVHLYDAYTGQIRATYRPYNSLDELDSPNAFSFLHQGQHFVTGGFRRERELQIFDLARPGRDALVTLKLGKTRKSSDGQKGLVSSLRYSSYHNLIACGTYAPGSIYLYDARAQSAPTQQVVVSGHCVVGHGKAHSRKRKHYAAAAANNDNDNDINNNTNAGNNGNDDQTVNFSSAKIKWFQSRASPGVTQLEFSEDGGNFLYSLSRRSNAVLQWDLRKLATTNKPFCPGINSFETDNDTNQRLEFALHQNHLFVGGKDSCVRVYDCNGSSSGEVAILKGDFDNDNSVNGISVTSLGDKTLMASATGSRSFPTDADYDDNDDDNDADQTPTASSGSSIRIHELPNFQGPVSEPKVRWAE